MAGSLDYAKEWMRDGDRLLERAGQRLISAAGDDQPSDIEMAVSDFSRAAQMYLTGAVEYQQGREAVQRAIVRTRRHRAAGPTPGGTAAERSGGRMAIGATAFASQSGDASGRS